MYIVLFQGLVEHWFFNIIGFSAKLKKWFDVHRMVFIKWYDNTLYKLGVLLHRFNVWINNKWYYYFTQHKSGKQRLKKITPITDLEAGVISAEMSWL
jgi:hypothetical protein